MNTLLDALQEGRLIELPENDKEESLRFLSHVLEATVWLPTNTDVVSLVLTREQQMNTTLGKGWACPHARLPFEEELLCAVGWSPTGINYGAIDGQPVFIVAMYLVPENQRNSYLREMSLLAKALTTYPKLEELRAVKDLGEVRDHLLDLMTSTKESVGPESRARMIQLQARPSAAPTAAVGELTDFTVEVVTIISGVGIKPVILTQNRGLTESLDSATGLIEGLTTQRQFLCGGWRIVARGVTSFQGDRILHDCLAIRMAGGKEKG